MPMAMGAVQVENHRSSFQMRVVKSTIIFIPVACDLFILYRVSQKNRKLLKSLIVKIECPAKKLNVMMRKILTRCMY